MKEKQVSVMVGKLADPHTIATEEGQSVKINEWQGRAAWSYLRLVYGRKIDDTIKKAGEQGQAEDCQYELIRTAKQDKPLQFIMSSNNVLAVATLKHLLLEPQHVYATAEQIVGPLVYDELLHGRVSYFDGWAGIKTGVQIDGGDLTTRFAIRVGVFARVEMCFNPLSWLGVSGLGRFGVPSDYERVLRIQKLNELFPRLKAAISNAQTHLADLEKRVAHAKTVPLFDKTALTLTGAMGLAYGLGEKTIKQVLDRYQEEPLTQYGLAMAQSWQAQHGEHRKTPEGREDRVPQSLSTISGATLLLDDVKAAEAKAKKWLGEQKSQLARDLLGGKLP